MESSKSTANPCYISYLPDEVLCHILKHVARLPYEVEPERIITLYKNQRSDEKLRVHEYYEHMNFVFTTIKLVSKQWYIASIPFQREWVIIAPKYPSAFDKSKQWTLRRSLAKRDGIAVQNLDNLISLFSNTLAICNPYQPATWWTKRFDFVFRTRTLWLAMLVKLATLIPLFPNIEILTLTIQQPDPCNDAPPREIYGTSWDLASSHLLQSVPSTIKVISLEGFLISAHTWRNFLFTHPNITTINPPMVLNTRAISEIDMYKVESPPLFPHLIHIATDYRTWNHSWTLGNIVERLTVELKGSTEDQLESENGVNLALSSSFFQHTRRTLRPTNTWLASLHIVMPDIGCFGEIRNYTRLFRECKSLERLEVFLKRPTTHQQLSFSRGLFQDAASILSSSIKSLGITLNSSSHKESAIQSESLLNMEILSILTRWNVPGVEPIVLQFLDESSVDRILATSSLILKNSPALITSWFMPDGTRMDLTELGDEEIKKMERVAKRRVHDKEYLVYRSPLVDFLF